MSEIGGIRANGGDFFVSQPSAKEKTSAKIKPGWKVEDQFICSPASSSQYRMCFACGLARPPALAEQPEYGAIGSQS